MKFLALAVFLCGGAALACQLNTDCEVGSTCIKAYGELYGVCAGGMNPGNGYDKQPTRSRTGDKTGQGCQFSIDCGAGGSCVKEAGQLEGVCFGGY